jgi:hypothetical protein
MAHLAESTVQLFLCEMGVITHSTPGKTHTPSPPRFFKLAKFCLKEKFHFKSAKYMWFFEIFPLPEFNFNF